MHPASRVLNDSQAPHYTLLDFEDARWILLIFYGAGNRLESWKVVQSNWLDLKGCNRSDNNDENKDNAESKEENTQYE